MNKYLIAICLVCAFGNSAAAFEFRCRGPLTLAENQGVRDYSFRRASAGAGANGENLVPGQCAWVDRPTNASEPRSFQYRPGEWVTDKAPATDTMLQQLYYRMIEPQMRVDRIESYLMRSDVVVGADATASGGNLYFNWQKVVVSPFRQTGLEPPNPLPGRK